MGAAHVCKMSIDAFFGALLSSQGPQHHGPLQSNPGSPHPTLRGSLLKAGPAAALPLLLPLPMPRVRDMPVCENASEKTQRQNARAQLSAEVRLTYVQRVARSL